MVHIMAKRAYDERLREVCYLTTIQVNSTYFKEGFRRFSNIRDIDIYYRKIYKLYKVHITV